MPALTFVVGSAGDVFTGDLAQVIESELHKRFSPGANLEEEAYRSEPVDAAGWRELQKRVLRTLDLAPQITSVDAYQAVYLPDAPPVIEHLSVANLADALQVGSVPALIEELKRFAEAASLPTDDLELMQLGAHFLESDDESADLDIQTYVQLMLSAKQAMARRQELWVVT